MTREHLSQPRQGECSPPLPPHCPTQHPLLQHRRDPEVMQGVCGAAWTAVQSIARATGTGKYFLSDFGSFGCGFWLHHSRNGDLDLLPSEQSRCRCDGITPGGLKLLPMSPFLPPRCILCHFCAAPGTTSLPKVGDSHSGAAGSWCSLMIWPCRVTLLQPPSLILLPCMRTQPHSPAALLPAQPHSPGQLAGFKPVKVK